MKKLICTLTKCYPKVSKPIIGTLIMLADQSNYVALFDDLSGERIAELERPKIYRIDPTGIHMDGLEPDGIDKQGTPRYKHQEWICSYYGFEEES